MYLGTVYILAAPYLIGCGLSFENRNGRSRHWRWHDANETDSDHAAAVDAVEDEVHEPALQRRRDSTGSDQAVDDAVDSGEEEVDEPVPKRRRASSAKPSEFVLLLTEDTEADSK